MVWCLVWLFTAFDSPDKHPRISLEEREYIKASLADGDNKETVRSLLCWSFFSMYMGLLCNGLLSCHYLGSNSMATDIEFSSSLGKLHGHVLQFVWFLLPDDLHTTLLQAGFEYQPRNGNAQSTHKLTIFVIQ